MSKRTIEAVYPLSPMQQGMLFHTLYAPDSGAYVELLTCTLRGNLDTTAFRNAWQHVLERHTILRTAFAWKNTETMLQVVQREVKLPFDVQDWRHLSATEQEEQLETFLHADCSRGFELSQAPLMRLTLLHTADDAHQLVWTLHHALIDGWSQPVLLQEVFKLYDAYATGQALQLPPVRPYRDYIVWLQKQDMARAETFWRNQLAGFTAPTPLIVDYATQGTAQDAIAGTSQQKIAHLSRATSAALQTLARQHQITLNTIIQGAWVLLLSRYSGEEDVLFGATVSGRPADLPGVETIIGLFINTLPVRVRVTPDTPLITWLKGIREQQVELNQYEYAPLVQIQGWSDVPRGLPLFESILVFENYPVNSAMDGYHSSLAIENVRDFSQVTYPIGLTSWPSDEIELQLFYDTNRFAPDTIERLLGHLATILEAIATNPQQRLADVSLLTEAERQQVLMAWNDTAADFPLEQCVHHLVAAQAQQTPDALAVVYADQQLTYRDLNQCANHLAHLLQNLGVQPETLVGICVERSVEMVVCVLGVLKAGAAYLPLDASYPQERLTFMLQDAQPAVLLTQQTLADNLTPAHGARVVILDTDTDRSAISQQPATNPESSVSATNLAYMIYTSGSTGQPRGVMVEHCSLTNAYYAWEDAYQLRNATAPHTHLQMANFAFDVCTGDMVRALCSGGTLVICPREFLLEPQHLYGLMCQHRVTCAEFVPAVLRLLVQHLDESGQRLDGMCLLICGSDTWSLAEYQHIRSLCSNETRLINSFGLTEATIDSTYFEGTVVDASGDQVVPIGHPFANTQTYILDSHCQPVPIGVRGELYIGGIGVARGYHNRPDMTAAKFLANPFANGATPNGHPPMLYRTGDMARYLPDGTIEFLGRGDEQIKIRGFRIEPGEVEAVLGQHPTLRDVVVLARKHPAGELRLVAYSVPTHDDAPTPADVRRFGQERLPDYMVPSAFVMLDALPLTPNGKVDRRALPDPDWSQRDLEAQYSAPRTPTEEIVAGLWSQILGVSQVGAHDNFFELGGHSLLATRLVSRVREAFQVELPLRTLFETPIVATLSEQIDTLRLSVAGTGVAPIQPVPRDGDIPLSFAQQRLWFLDQLEPESPLYNIPTPIRMTGPLDVDALERSINEIVRRHESLRTTFTSVHGRPMQVIAPQATVPLPLIDLRETPRAEREAEAFCLVTEDAQRPFTLAEGPLMRTSLLRLDDEEYIVMLNMHHIISDGWSMGVLIHEMTALYNAFIADESSPLPDLPVQYADFTYWQRDWFQGEVLETQMQYWKQQLAGIPALLELPTDRPRPPIQTYHGASQTFEVSPDLCNKLQALSQQEGATLFMILLATFQVLLSRYSGQDDICVGMPIANRTQAEVEPLIGFFVNTLVLRMDLSSVPNFRSLLKRVRQVTLDAYAHQDLPFEMLVEALQPERNLSHSPLFQVLFAYQNMSMPLDAFSNLKLTPLEDAAGIARFDINLEMSDEGDHLKGVIEYNTDLFDATTIARMIAHFQTLLNGIVADSEQPVTTLPLLTPAERQRILVDWNKTATPFPADHCIHHLFEARVNQHPDMVALTFEETTLTYRELNDCANQLAHTLQQRGVGPETIVALCTERSPQMIIGVLGILKAGGAYVPLDPNYPPERLSFMLHDSQAPILLTQRHLVEALPEVFHTLQQAPSTDQAQLHPARPQIIYLDSDWDAIAQQPATNPSHTASPDNLAYIIYTSGSTGQPKGTMLRHRGLCNLSNAQRIAFEMGNDKRVLQFSPFSFDASVWEIVMALSNGATLCLARQETLASGPDLVRLLRDRAITTVTLPPSLLAVLPADELPALTTIIAAGEKCTAELVARWGPGRRFFNAYGPTETTVCASMYLCDTTDPIDPPIGRPIANFDLYILDAHGQPVPAGVPGELHVGGVGLARGYLNRPELTSAKFIPHPFDSSRPDARLYRTGDLVRYRDDGTIEFLGRIDHQVKVRGFRIELGEIESALRQHAAVQDAVVLAREDVPGDQRLVAYIIPDTSGEGDTTSDAEQTLPVAELRASLRDTLPEYMLPSAFVAMEAWPLSPSGKVDRKALPAPDSSHADLAEEYVAPRTPTEETLVALCAEVLNLERVGIHDNFFQIGGHSLLATQFASRVRDTLSIELPLRSLFEHPTMAELAEEVETLQQADQGNAEKIAQLLEQIDQLSEEEVEALLGEVL